MHETMIAQSIVETIAKEAEKTGAKPIAARISCGQLNPINDEVLNFALQKLRTDIRVRHILTRMRCVRQQRFWHRAGRTAFAGRDRIRGRVKRLTIDDFLLAIVLSGTD